MNSVCTDSGAPFGRVQQCGEHSGSVLHSWLNKDILNRTWFHVQKSVMAFSTSRLVADASYAADCCKSPAASGRIFGSNYRAWYVNQEWQSTKLASVVQGVTVNGNLGYQYPTPKPSDDFDNLLSVLSSSSLWQMHRGRLLASCWWEMHKAPSLKSDTKLAIDVCVVHSWKPVSLQPQTAAEVGRDLSHAIARPKRRAGHPPWLGWQRWHSSSLLAPASLR